ncbi:MAG TPA: hypothetical protein VJA82_02060 [Sediminibacterium sp.]|jgi:hypothetical protein|uniref:hypothetical protein n=1 Tax=Sediminibacterium sp. TaxID=1917865 RepID=UPI0008D1BCCF|nr:hypothetical protein [Sediminibacterium sp.]OHC86583.1 MAG: hypothetical protein A2472_03185 [Sphingobacteriia bacterium RIFOXYC2_FULL_35_18]OHC88560.1 MAG: hypothetical protein A2546_14060 [Sphingobacteriia bacterium RIFOXYD2_FULL_35_12]HLD52065.1 hypothetical protein [Sediminibacterium sp.]
MKLKFGNFGTLLTRSQAKSIIGGYMVEDPSSCTVDCTGCPPYKCTSNCEAMKNGESVTCDGVTKKCKAYPTCWE